MPHVIGMLKKDVRLVEPDARLVWPRDQLCQATGLCYRTLQNLEKRGLLERVNTGLKAVLYSDSSVRRLFGSKEAA